MSFAISTLAHPGTVTPVSAVGSIRYDTSADARREAGRRAQPSTSAAVDGPTGNEHLATFGVGTLLDTLA